ncbi:MAG: helix-turn-helix transcriptional regulator [Clostridium sp.]|uniref:helix-turn-helix transcriptional regulator n=1 Tax=Clostridium sp. TaxID=1506 RepID=UPI003F38C35A
MSSLGNCIKMLAILNNKEIVSRKYLAEKLNCDIRQITRYKKILEEIFIIESVQGANGGYRLIDNSIPIKEILSEDDIELLKFNLRAIGNLEDSKIIEILDNMKNYISKRSTSFEVDLIPYSQIKPFNEELSNRRIEILRAILDSYEVRIEYEDNYGQITERDVEPYKILIYKGESYLAANCLKRKGIRFFKVRRIKRHFIKTKKFNKVLDIEKIIKDYKKNNIGIFSGEILSLKLKIKPPMANIVKERVWVEDYTIENLKKGEIIFSAKMKDGPELKSWIGSMLDKVEILEPKELKEEMKKIYKNFSEYKK